jgi:5'-AMP-activated protein kinase regulatory gamma subunit
MAEVLRKIPVTGVFPSKDFLVVVSQKDHVADVLQKFTEFDILSAPIVSDEDEKKLIGLVDMMDLVKFVVDLFEKEEIEELSLPEIIQRSKQVVFEVSSANQIRNVSHLDTCLPVSDKANVYEVMKSLASGVHRVPVIDNDGKVVNLITQSVILDILENNSPEMGPVVNSKISELEAIHPQVITITEKGNTVMDAFTLLTKNRISAVPIVNEKNQIVGTVSVKDIRMIAKEKAVIKVLYQTLTAFLEATRKDFDTPNKPITVKSDVTLKTVIKNMCENRIHRLYVTDADNKVTGVVSITDVIRVVLKHLEA